MGLAVVVSAAEAVQGDGLTRMPYAFVALDFIFLFTCPYCGWQGRVTVLASAVTISPTLRLTIIGLVSCRGPRAHEWTITNGGMTSLSLKGDRSL
jgi:hypothetical protein